MRDHALVELGSRACLSGQDLAAAASTAPPALEDAEHATTRTLLRGHQHYAPSSSPGTQHVLPLPAGGVKVESQRLLCGAKEMREDGCKLAQYGVKAGSVITQVTRLRGGC